MEKVQPSFVETATVEIVLLDSLAMILTKNIDGCQGRCVQWSLCMLYLRFKTQAPTYTVSA